MKTAHRRASRAKRKYTADPLAINKVMNKIQPFNAGELLQLELPIRSAYESIRTGRGTVGDLSDIGTAINATLIRSESIDPLCVQTAIAARDALLRSLMRYRKTGKVGFDGPALAEVELGIDLHEQILRLSTPLQMADALREVQKRVAEQQALGDV